MKKLLLLILVLTYRIGFSQVTAPQPVTVKSGTVIVSGDSLNKIAKRLAVIQQYMYDGLANGILDGMYAQETNINNNTVNGNVNTRYINRKLDSLINYTRSNNNKQDSMIYQQSTTSISFTVTSVNSATAISANQTVGSGVYSVTIPTGNWQITSAIMTSSLNTSSDVLRMAVFSGPLNIVAPAEGTSFAPSQAQMAELTEVFTTSSSNHLAMNGPAYNPFFLYNSTTNYSDGVVYPSGTLKCVITYGAGYTPSANNVYRITIRMKRIS